MKLSKKILFGNLLALLLIAAPVSFLHSNFINTVRADPTCSGGETLETGPFTNAPAGTNYACTTISSINPEQPQVVYSYYNQGGTFLGTNAGGGTFSPTGQVISVGTEGTTPGSCSFSNFTFNSCIWQPLTSALAAFMLSISAFVLEVAGYLFDVLIQWTVISFATTIGGGITTAITTGWDLFRDVANILIIGMFVFVAIGIILGLKEYGQKALVARVLIVAVLLNFSLLFTKMIIDFSNFAAYQFYIPMATADGLAPTNGSYDIASGFLAPMGITSIFNTGTLTTQIAAATGSGWQTLAFGIVGSILLIAIALVLFYGCFLLASRAIILIILMVTSAAAFATHMIPKVSEGNYGWSTWWKALINAAVLAPLMMLFLFLSLAIVKAAGIVSGSGISTTNNIGTTIGSLMTGTGGLTTSAWGGILTYFIAIGVLFATFKISSSLASSVSGFSLASALPGTLAGLGSRFGGVVGRNTLGYVGARRARSLDDQLKAAQARGDGGKADAARLGLRLERSKRFGIASLGKRDFNMGNTGIGALAKQSGISSLTSGSKKVGGYDKVAAEAAKRGVEAGKKVLLSDRQKADVRENATKEYREREHAREQRKQMEQLHEDAKANLEAVKSSAKQNKETLEKERESTTSQLKTLTDNHSDQQTAYDKQIKELGEQLQKAAGTADADAVRTRMQGVQAQRDSDMRQNAQKIDQVKTQLQEIQTGIENQNERVSSAESNARQHAEDIEKDKKRVDAAAEEHGKRVADQTARQFQVAGENVAARSASIIPGSFKGEAARSAFRKSLGKQRLKERLEAWRELGEEEGVNPEQKH